jgi:DNA-binding LacI/PurR family transcriptional regulator
LHARKMQVPKHISVVGYDDLPESRFFKPPLTTVHHDFYQTRRTVRGSALALDQSATR